MSEPASAVTPARGRGGRFLLRLVLAYTVLVTIVVVFERPMLSATTPLARLGLIFLEPKIVLNQLTIENGNMIASVLVEPTGRTASRQSLRGSVRTNARTMLVMPVLTLSVLWAWRFKSGSARAVALASGLVLAAVLLVHDYVHCVAAGIVEKLDGARSAGERLLSFYSFLLQNGGRQLLALMAAALVLWLTARWGPQPTLVPATASPERRRRRRN